MNEIIKEAVESTKKKHVVKKELTHKELYIKLLKSVKREGINNLIKYLEESDFFVAPASTMYHGSYKGGLVEHCLNVLDSITALNKFIITNKYNVEPLNKESMIIVALLHDVCKINCYVEDFRNVKNDNGVWEKVPCYKRKPKLAMGHAGKSVYIIQNFIDLTTQEAQAIFWHMGAYDTSPYNTWNEMGQAYEENLLAFLLHQADMISTYILENKNYK